MRSIEPCAICAAPALVPVGGFQDLDRVTSDCRPFRGGGTLAICSSCGLVQKPASDTWLRDIGEIYSRYDMFRQADAGDEQLVFMAENGHAMRRSFALLDRLSRSSGLPRTGTAIDIGCGNGAMLKAIGAVAPDMELHGSEQSPATLTQLQRIPNFTHLHTGAISGIDRQYDLVTLSHSLEHFADPVGDLSRIGRLLTESGLLIVEVPDCVKNIYDILVADHRSHFTGASLRRCAQLAGLTHALVTDRLIPKELTLVAARQPAPIAALAATLGPPDPEEPAGALGVDDLQCRVTWLKSVQSAARQAARAHAQFGLFGTSIAASWLFGSLRDATCFFVDEDPSRIGNRHEDRPILGPAEVPAGAAVFLCLLPEIAHAIADRLAGQMPGRFILPPGYTA